jgi:predicted AlkP superfamily phosphohydrolase/phosphomutase
MQADLLGLPSPGLPSSHPPSHIRPYLCGCFFSPEASLDNGHTDGVLPLTKATYNVDIFNGLSEVTLVQHYLNHT